MNVPPHIRSVSYLAKQTQTGRVVCSFLMVAIPL